MHTHRLCSADDLLPYVPFTTTTGDVVKVVYYYNVSLVAIYFTERCIYPQ